MSEFNIEEALAELSMDPNELGSIEMLKVLVAQHRRLNKLEEAVTQCGQPALCAHNPDGGNHPFSHGTEHIPVMAAREMTEVRGRPIQDNPQG
jgi:hypothetical protein